MVDLKDFEYNGLEAFLKEHGEPKFRAEQIFSWLHKGVTSYDEMTKKYDPEKLHYGYNTVDGEEIYYIPNPALGLWMNKEKL